NSVFASRLRLKLAKLYETLIWLPQSPGSARAKCSCDANQISASREPRQDRYMKREAVDAGTRASNPNNSLAPIPNFNLPRLIIPVGIILSLPQGEQRRQNPDA